MTIQSLVLALFLLGGVSSAHANWYSDGTHRNADIIMKEVRYPFWARGWYNAFWNGRFLPQGGRYYGGFAAYGPDQDDIEKQQAYSPELVWTFWGSPDYKGMTVQNLYNPPQGIEFKGSGNEGAQGGSTGRPTFMRTKTWYNMLMRTWPSEDVKEVSYVGWWIKDMGTGEWHTVGIFRVPCRVTGFSGNAEFAEYIGGQGHNRVFERRNGYCRAEGKWHHMNTMHVRGAQWATLTPEGNVIRFDSHARKERHSEPIDVSIPEQSDPVLDQPFIQSAAAGVYNNQITINWEIPLTAAPQRAYRLTAYSSPDGRGEVLATVSKAHPHIRLGSITARRAKSICLTITDVFDQEISRVIPVGPLVPQRALAQDVPRRAGIQYRFYEAPRGEEWTELPAFEDLNPSKSGIVKSIDDTIRERRGHQYALQFDGFLKVAEDGVYLFEYRMAGIGKLSIGDKVVIDTGGNITRSPIRQAIALKRGIHPLRLETLKVGSVRRGGNSIDVRWAGRDGVLKPIDTGDLSCAPGESLPAVSISAASLSHVKRITPSIELNGKKLRKIEYYSGLKLIRAVYPEKDSPLSVDLLIPQDGAELTSSELNLGILLPQRNNKIHARLWTTDNKTIYSNVIDLEGAKNSLASPWKLKSDISSTTIAGVRATKDSIAIIGAGSSFVYQPVSGDFTITAHIARSPRTGRDNNSGYTGGNRFGIEIGGPGTRNFSIYQLAKGGVKVSTDAANLDGWNVSYWKMPKPEYSWFRISKEGDLASSFVSDDGKTWQCAAKRVGGFGRDIHIGMTYITKPGDTALYHATIDQIRIEPEAFYLPRVMPTDSEIDTERRISAIIQSPSHRNILLARTTHAGVLKSTDHGETWKSINAGISTKQLATRSIAVHPSDPNVLLRASCGVSGDRPSHFLHRSADGGKSWKTVASNIDFGVTRLSLLFGEIICFNPLNPDVVAVAGESTGLFISHDAGKSWKNAGLEGQFISTLLYHPYMKRGQNSLHIGTMPDSEWAVFGDSAHRTEPGNELGKIMIADEDGAKRKVHYQHSKLGAIRFVPAKSYNRFACATTRGIYYTSQNKHDLFLRPVLPRQTPYIALTEEILHKEQRTIRNRGPISEFYAAPFVGSTSSEMYRSILKAYNWHTARSRAYSGETVSEELWGKVAPGPVTNVNFGITSLLRHHERDHTVYACNTKGIFISTDFAKTWRCLLSTR
ncbi:MAG: hypothetical protein HN341_06760 [Verrucomicrobia bacterium]|nr:hypothetical protein [Verrucomicrobiota bacterium]